MNQMVVHKLSGVPAVENIPGKKLNTLMALFFVATALSFPIQIFFLQDRSFNDLQDWLAVPGELTVLNWLCIFSYSLSAVALKKNWSKVWACLTASFLLTAINNTFLAFVGWDYSPLQLLAGSLVMGIPLAIKTERRKAQSWQVEGPAPRLKKRWKVEILTAGEVVPTTGVTLNISTSGALVHWFGNEKINGKAIDLRLTDALEGHVIDCQARAVRRDQLQYGAKPFPVMGLQFMNLSEGQKEALKKRLK